MIEYSSTQSLNFEFSLNSNINIVKAMNIFSNNGMTTKIILQ